MNMIDTSFAQEFEREIEETPFDPALLAVKYRWFLIDSPEPYADRVERLLEDMRERRPQIEAALIYAHHTHTFDDLFAMVLAGKLIWWCLPNSFMLTEIHNFPRRRAFHMFLGGGKFEEMVGTHADVIRLARSLGCNQLTISGRPGWERGLRPFGWEPYFVTMAKEI